MKNLILQLIRESIREIKTESSNESDLSPLNISYKFHENTPENAITIIYGIFESIDQEDYGKDPTPHETLKAIRDICESVMEANPSKFKAYKQTGPSRPIFPTKPNAQNEMTTTGAVQGYMTPGAFKPTKKKKIKEEQPEPYDAETDTFAPGPRQRPEDWKRGGGGRPKFRVQYAVLGLEQIPDSVHIDKKEAMKAASEFIQSYKRGPDNKVERLPNGVALKHMGGGTVAIATIEPIK